MFSAFIHEILEYLFTVLEENPEQSVIILVEALAGVFVMVCLVTLGLLKIHMHRVNYRMVTKMQIFLLDACT